MEPEKPVETKSPAKPRIFIDSDVLFAGAASPNEHSASNLILRMAELTLIEAIASTQVITEVERNLQEKMPKALPAFHLLVTRCLKVMEDPKRAEIKEYHGLADTGDLPILVTAIREGCSFLATFNIRHYQPGHSAVAVLRPGDLVLRIRYLLARLSE
jgi:predicted nucleic acid-binding protein